MTKKEKILHIEEVLKVADKKILRILHLSSSFDGILDDYWENRIDSITMAKKRLMSRKIALLKDINQQTPN